MRSFISDTSDVTLHIWTVYSSLLVRAFERSHLEEKHRQGKKGANKEGQKEREREKAEEGGHSTFPFPRAPTMALSVRRMSDTNVFAQAEALL